MAAGSGEIPVDDADEAAGSRDDDVVGREVVVTDRVARHPRQLPAHRLGRHEVGDGAVEVGERPADVVEQRLAPDPGRPSSSSPCGIGAS